MKKMKVGIIGCGNISGIYAEAGQKFRNLEILACADLDFARAHALAEKHGIPRPLRVEQLLADRDIELVINLTIPAAHAEIDREALRRALHRHTATTRYLKAIAAGGRRFGLDGLAIGDISEEQRQLAGKALKERFRRPAELAREAEQARARQAKLELLVDRFKPR